MLATLPLRLSQVLEPGGALVGLGAADDGEDAATVVERVGTALDDLLET